MDHTISPHDAATLFQRPDQLSFPLYVIAPVFNPVRWRSRWRLWEDFEKHCADAGAILYTVEAAFGQRAFAVAQPTNPRHIRLRTSHELFLKECLVNAAVRFLPDDWQRVAMVDADMAFTRPDWANETLHQLEHYAAVQMWSQIQDLTPQYESRWSNVSFMWVQLHGDETPQNATAGYPMPPAPWPPRGPFGSPGGAWAWRRDAWDAVGGMLDVAILGSGDFYMARGLMGTVESAITKSGFSAGYRRQILEWQERARALKKNIGVVPGLMLHHWHGPRRGRGYDTRNAILAAHQFNPDVHLWRDWQGLWQLHADAVGLRDQVRAYFRQRNEDSIDG